MADADRTAGPLAGVTLPDGVETWHVGVLLLVVGIAFAVTPLYVQLPGDSLLFFDVAILFLVYALLVVGLNLHFGHTGLVNFGHVAFFAVGGYAAAMITAENPFRGLGLGLPWPVGIAGAILAFANPPMLFVTLAAIAVLAALIGLYLGRTG